LKQYLENQLAEIHKRKEYDQTAFQKEKCLFEATIADFELEKASIRMQLESEKSSYIVEREQWEQSRRQFNNNLADVIINIKLFSKPERL
jgi:hypothetical protein